MKKLLISTLIGLALFLSASLAHASKTTHALGDAVYAIGWARDLHANRIAPEYYWSAVMTLKKAQERFQAQEEEEAYSLALEAKEQAELARKAAY